MKQFIKLAWQWLLAVFIIATNFWIMQPVYQLGFTKFQGDKTVNALPQWVKTGGLIFLFFILWIIKTIRPQQQAFPSTKKTIELWKIVLVCTSIILVSVAVFNIWADPWDIYVSDALEPRALPSRTVKLGFYSQLTEPPEMIIVGSSAAFRIAPTYIQEKTGIRAFNWSINGGKSAEIKIFLDYIAHQHDGEFPEVILMQVLENPPSKGYNQLPVALFPCLDFWSQIQEGSLRLSKSIYLSQLSDSYYVLRYKLSPHTKSLTNFYCLEDGYSDRIQGEYSEAAALRQAEKIPDCNSVDEVFGTDIESIVAFSEEKHSSIIFYFSPVLPAFYDNYMKDNTAYQNCHQMVTEYFTKLSEEHDNVFFKDYVLLESINGLDGADGFYDSQHLNPKNSEKLIDSLSDIILQAYTVAESQRRTEGGGSE